MNDKRLTKWCPFCGGEPTLRERPPHRWVECIDCGATTNGSSTVAGAIAYWERRSIYGHNQSEIVGVFQLVTGRYVCTSCVDLGKHVELGATLLVANPAYSQFCAKCQQVLHCEKTSIPFESLASLKQQLVEAKLAQHGEAEHWESCFDQAQLECTRLKKLLEKFENNPEYGQPSATVAAKSIDRGPTIYCINGDELP